MQTGDSIVGRGEIALKTFTVGEDSHGIKVEQETVATGGKSSPLLVSPARRGKKLGSTNMKIGIKKGESFASKG